MCVTFLYNYVFRECIMPDVCRTYHFATGVHINEVKQKRYFETHSFNRETKLHQLQTKKYEIYPLYFFICHYMFVRICMTHPIFQYFPC